MKVQILYPIYELDENAKKRLFTSIYSIKSQVEDENVEFCISDGSKEATDLTNKPFGKYKYYHEPISKYSKSIIINNGVRNLINEDVFIVSDIDIKFHKKYIENCLYYYKKYNKNIVGPVLFKNYDKFRYGSSFFVKYRTFNKVNGFNENFYGWGPEEIDFLFKVQMENDLFIEEYNGNNYSFHLPHNNSSEDKFNDLIKNFFLFQKNKLSYMRGEY